MKSTTNTPGLKAKIALHFNVGVLLVVFVFIIGRKSVAEGQTSIVPEYFRHL